MGNAVSDDILVVEIDLGAQPVEECFEIVAFKIVTNIDVGSSIAHVGLSSIASNAVDDEIVTSARINQIAASGCIDRVVAALEEQKIVALGIVESFIVVTTDIDIDVSITAARCNHFVDTFRHIDRARIVFRGHMESVDDRALVRIPTDLG